MGMTGLDPVEIAFYSVDSGYHLAVRKPTSELSYAHLPPGNYRLQYIKQQRLDFFPPRKTQFSIEAGEAIYIGDIEYKGSTRLGSLNMEFISDTDDTSQLLRGLLKLGYVVPQ